MDRLRLIVGWTVLVLWAISFVLSALLHGYQTPDGLSALMGVVTGALFAPALLGFIGKRNGA